MEKRSILRPTGEEGKQPPTKLRKVPGKATGTVRGTTQLHTGEARTEVTDRRIPCYAQVRLHTEAGRVTISFAIEIAPGIGWQAERMQPLLQRC